MENVALQVLNESIFKAVASLNHMLQEMLHKNLELKRMTKVASLLLKSGFNLPSTFSQLENKCLISQHSDGGWVSIVDTMWNMYFLTLLNSNEYSHQIDNAKNFIIMNQGKSNLWGRSIRDFERIPVSGLMLSLFPEFASLTRLNSLETLWKDELYSLTYKASYTLMAFNKNNYIPIDIQLIPNTIQWLIANQRDDGSYAPWKKHPVISDVYCTSIALLGLLSYKSLVPSIVLQKAVNWLIETQLSSGIWSFHEIEDGASWGLYALVEYKRSLYN